MAMQAGVGSKFTKIKHFNGPSNRHHNQSSQSRIAPSHKNERRDYNKSYSPKQVPVNSNDEIFKPVKSLIPVTPQHEENVRFLTDEWERVKNKLKEQTITSGVGSAASMYHEKSQYKYPSNFQAFDLEKYWGEKFLVKTGVSGDLDIPSKTT